MLLSIAAVLVFIAGYWLLFTDHTPLGALAFAVGFAAYGSACLIEIGWKWATVIAFVFSAACAITAAVVGALERREDERNQEKKEGKDACKGLGT